MQRVVLRAKIHRATVTDADLDDEDSCALGPELLAAADLVPFEQVHVVNVSNGSRAATYAVEGRPARVALNGAMAHVGGPGDLVVIIAYAHLTEAELATHRPRLVRVDADNRVREEVAVT